MRRLRADISTSDYVHSLQMCGKFHCASHSRRLHRVLLDVTLPILCGSSAVRTVLWEMYVPTVRFRFSLNHSSLGIAQYSCEYGSMRYYILCGIGGMISCGITHTALVPLVCASHSMKGHTDGSF